MPRGPQLVQRLSGPRAKGMFGPAEGPSDPQCFQEAASGQSSAKSSRGRVIGGALALSRQRSLNRSSAFSTTMASHHAGHRLSALASTRWPISMSSQSLGSDWALAARFAATALSCFAWTSRLLKKSIYEAFSL